jgi:hypothetical protein
MDMYLTGTVISALVIGLSALSLEAIFARYATLRSLIEKNESMGTKGNAITC